VLVLGSARHEALDTVALALGDQRADLVFGVVGKVELDRGDGRREVGDEPVVDLGVGIDAAGGGAVLAGIVIAEGADTATTASISASSKTMTGALPPSSRWVRLTVLAAAAAPSCRWRRRR
jgi:hypothetical protein